MFAIEEIIETKGLTSDKLTWSRSRFMGMQMERSDDLQSLLYLFCWIINFGEVPVERYDFTGWNDFMGNFDVHAYLKIELFDPIFEMMNQIKDERF